MYLVLVIRNIKAPQELNVHNLKPLEGLRNSANKGRLVRCYLLFKGHGIVNNMQIHGENMKDTSLLKIFYARSYQILTMWYAQLKSPMTLTNSHLMGFKSPY
ncbi:hypothetical protein Lal_00022976 [Lupinus albus]|nr:hypothetical protein Lal_00022976 [Lupinus albus]